MKENKIVNLVLEGGGVKGIGLVGAITELEKQGYSWNSIGGTSAGAIVATLLAVGYTGKELYEIICGPDIKFIDMMDDESVRNDFFKLEKLVVPALKRRRILPILVSLVRCLSPIFKLWKRLWQNHGLFDGEYIVDKVRELIKKKTGDDCFTFADLAHKNDGDETKLSLMVTDITNGRLLILPRDLEKLGSSPENMEIVKAMRMSMSFPFFFKPVKVPVPKAEFVLLMDGGVLSNFPYWYIEELAQTSKKAHPTIGVLLDEGPRPGILNLWGILDALLYTMISPLDRVGHRALSNRIVKVTTQLGEAAITRDISTFDFDLEQADKDKLFDNGRTAARNQIPLFEQVVETEKPAREDMKDWSRRKGTLAEAA